MVGHVFCIYNQKYCGRRLLCRDEIERKINNHRTLRDRLMVGHGPLKPSILVRVQVPQQLRIKRTRILKTRGFAQPAPPKAGLVERTLSSQNSEFVLSEAAAYLEYLQTFELILPNLIHKSKKRNLTK